MEQKKESDCILGFLHPLLGTDMQFLSFRKGVFLSC